MLNSIYLNRGTHGDSSFMLGGLPSSRENPPDLSVGSVKCGTREYDEKAGLKDDPLFFKIVVISFLLLS